MTTPARQVQSEELKIISLTIHYPTHKEGYPIVIPRARTRLQKPVEVPVKL
jgi:hypothetical protein